jgi:hypothetical protein
MQSRTERMGAQSLIERVRARLSPQPRNRMPDGPHEHVRLTNPWHAVSIVPGPRCCQAAAALAGTRFLSHGVPAHEAPPRLPIAGCEAQNCTCRYQHHVDRRHSPSRARLSPSAAPPPHPLRRADDAP